LCGEGGSLTQVVKYGKEKMEAKRQLIVSEGHDERVVGGHGCWALTRCSHAMLWEKRDDNGSTFETGEPFETG